MSTVSKVRVAWAAMEASIRALESGGKVDPLDLIEAARAHDHPCNHCFTWDVDQAASERWRDQARALIRSCHFEVVVDDVTTRVVSYVASPEGDAMFVSLPKIRSKGKASEILLAELRMLHGNASRVTGIALAKSNIVGPEIAVQVGAMRDHLAGMLEGMEE